MSKLLPFPARRAAIATAALDQASHGAHLLAYAQPQVNLQTLQPEGCEILARWQHPDRGLLFPDDVLPQLQTLEAFNRLSQALVSQALAAERRQPPRAARWSLAFNVMLEQLESDDLVAFLLDSQRQRRQAGDLVLEITEQALPGHPQASARALDNVQRLSDGGWIVSLDDFGTGESTYARLCSLPVAELKIDRRFVQYLGEGRLPDETLVRHLLQLTGDLGLDCVAEGIEFAEQLLFLQTLGCTRGQGYLFSPPLPLDALDDWCQRWQQGLEQPAASSAGQPAAVADRRRSRPAR